MGWKYRDIIEHGSTELKEIIFIITNGQKSPIHKEESEDERVPEKAGQ